MITRYMRFPGSRRFGAAFAAVALILTAGTQQAAAQGRAGIDRPVRVGMFKGTGTSIRYFHTNLHTAHTVLQAILSNPSAAGLGPDLSLPPKGFSLHVTALPRDSLGQECTGPGCGPTPAEITAFIAAMDTLDVIILNSVVDAGSRIPDATQRKAFQNFWQRKGYIAIHWTLDSYGSWAALDSIHGTRFQMRSNEVDGTVRRDSVFEQEPAWRYLNRSLLSNGLDTTLYDEWMYFTTSGATIRADAHLRPTLKLDEGSLVNPGGGAGAIPMGDHPVSWYKQLPTGGRFFFTSLGHRSQVWTSTRLFRRQLYNAILWTAKYDSLSSVSLRPGEGSDARPFDLCAEKGALHFASDFPARVSVRTADGRLAARRAGSGAMRLALPSAKLYLVTVSAEDGAVFTRRVTVP